jgi:RNA polymerase sigma factor (sigma-70 family)
MKQSRIENILLCLASGQVETGWTTFLDAYSSLINKIVGRYAAEASAVDDCFEYVCAKFSDDDFRRLRQFDPAGPARFRTWLTVATANLCRDWRRSQFGRQRQPSFVQKLPELEQQVFQLLFRKGMTHHECLHVIKNRYPKVKAVDIERISGELYRALSANQHWQLSLRRHDPISADEIELFDDTPATHPDIQLQHDQDLQRLALALARLEPEQRLLLQLRYQQDLTLNEVADLVGIDDPFKARRAIDKALAALKKSFDI